MLFEAMKTIFGLNLAWSLAANSTPTISSSAGKRRSCTIESRSCDCCAQSFLFLEKWRHGEERDVAVWNQQYTSGTIGNLQPHRVTSLYQRDEWQETTILVPPSQTILKRQKDETLPVLQNKNYTSSLLSIPGSSVPPLPNAASSQTGRSWHHVEHDRPPRLQAADAVGTRLLYRKSDYNAMILEHHHYRQQRDDIIQWLRDDDDDDDYFDGSSSTSTDVNVYDIALLVVFLFFGLNAAISLQQQIRQYDRIAIRRSRSWYNFNPRQPSHKQQHHCQQQQQHDQHEVPSYEAECPCCCEAYDLAPSWKRYHDGADVLRLPILSQACIHSYCLHCARQDRERLVQITPTILSTPTAVEQSFPLCFWTRPSTASAYCTPIRCPFCRQPNAFDIENPILRPDAYDAYVQQQKSQGKCTSKTLR
jgi:hypothetical protein